MLKALPWKVFFLMEIFTLSCIMLFSILFFLLQIFTQQIRVVVTQPSKVLLHLHLLADIKYIWGLGWGVSFHSSSHSWCWWQPQNPTNQHTQTHTHTLLAKWVEQSRGCSCGRLEQRFVLIKWWCMWSMTEDAAQWEEGGPSARLRSLSGEPLTLSRVCTGEVILLHNRVNFPLFRGV